MGDVIQFPSKPEQAPPTFKDFYFQCAANDLNAASKSLQYLFNADAFDARMWATNYQIKLQSDSNLVVKTMEIKEALDNGHTNDVLTLLQYCFGISIVDAINMYSALYANARK